MTVRVRKYYKVISSIFTFKLTRCNIKYKTIGEWNLKPNEIAKG